MPQTQTRTTTRTSRLVRHLEVLRTIAEAVSSLDVDEVVETSLHALTHVTGHEISSLHLLSPDGDRLLLRGDRGLSDRLREVNRVLPVGRGLVGNVAISGAPRRTGDVSRAGDLLPEARGPVADDGIRAFVCVPVRARQTVLGTLSLGRQAATAFSDDEVALLQCVADQIGLALDHARLHAETRRQLEDLERAQTAVVRAERLSAVGELTRGVAHEINNPLMIVLGQVQVLREDQPSESAQRGLEVIERAARRAAAVVRDLRQFAEPAPPLRAPCQLADHIRRALALHAERLDAEHIAWHTELEDVPPIWADAAHVDQLLNHLIENARHAMASAHEGGTLFVGRLVRSCPASGSRWATTGPASRPSTCLVSSTRSSPPRGRTTGAGSASRSATASSGSTAVASGRRTARPAARSSSSSCRSACGTRRRRAPEPGAVGAAARRPRAPAWYLRA